MTKTSSCHPMSIMANRVKNNSIDAITPPPKPYTEYTIFFRLEQTYIIQTTTGQVDEEVLDALKLHPNHHDPLEHPRPTKYRDIQMTPYWYSSAHKAAYEKKRKHRKRPGRMDLKTLSKAVSVAWKNASKEVVEYCRKLAAAEQDKYNNAMGLIKKSGGVVDTPVQKSQKKKKKKKLYQPSPPQATPTLSTASSTAESTPSASPALPLFNNGYFPTTATLQGQGSTNYGNPDLVHVQHLNGMNGNMTYSMGGSNNNNMNMYSPMNMNGSNNMTHPSTSAYIPPAVSSGAGLIPSHEVQELQDIFRNDSPIFADSPTKVSLSSFGTTNTNTYLAVDFRSVQRGALKRRATVDTACLPPSSPNDQHELKRMRETTSFQYMGESGRTLSSTHSSDGDIHQKKTPSSSCKMPMKRRASVSTGVPEHEAVQLRVSFQEELANVGAPFVCIPKWDQEDAETLLGMLNDSTSSPQDEDAVEISW